MSGISQGRQRSRMTTVQWVEGRNGQGLHQNEQWKPSYKSLEKSVRWEAREGLNEVVTWYDLYLER